MFSTLKARLDSGALTLRETPYLVWLAAVYLFLWGPTVLVIYIGFGQSSRTTLPVESFSLRWFTAFLNDDAMVGALLNSLSVAAVSAILATIIGVATSLALQDKFRGWTMLNYLSITPLIIFRVVLGISLLILFSLIGIPLGFWAVTIGLATVSAAYSALIISSRFNEFDQAVEEAAIDLGASRFETIIYVILPIIRPAIVSSLFLSFTIAFDELLIALFVQGFNFEVLPVHIFGLLQYSSTPKINAVATLMTMLAIVFMSISFYLSRDSGQPAS